MALAAAFTALPALTMPAPHCEVEQSRAVPTGKGLAVLINIDLTCADVKDGLTDNISDTTPATTGDAMLVP